MFLRLLWRVKKCFPSKDCPEYACQNVNAGVGFSGSLILLKELLFAMASLHTEAFKDAVLRRWGNEKWDGATGQS